MQAIILAGGFGTRLRSEVSDVPKPMAPIDNNTPFLAYLIRFLKKEGITSITLATGYLAEKVEEYFGSEFEGVPINYAVEKEALGTGGAIYNAYHNIKIKDEPILVCNGDTFFAADIRSLGDFHKKEKADITLALKALKDFDRYGQVIIDSSNKILSFEEKKYCNEGLINGGIYIITPKIFDYLKNISVPFSFEKSVLESKLEAFSIYGKAFESYFIDIGIPEDYKKSKKDLRSLV